MSLPDPTLPRKRWPRTGERKALAGFLGQHEGTAQPDIGRLSVAGTMPVKVQAHRPQWNGWRQQGGAFRQTDGLRDLLRQGQQDAVPHHRFAGSLVLLAARRDPALQALTNQLNVFH